MQMQRALAPPRVAIYNRPKFRAVFYQFALLAALVWLGYEFALNAKANLDAQKITSGFGFLENTAGFAVNQSLIPYNESDTYGRVFVVGLLNTLLVAGIGIVLATILGFAIGIARLSRNWLLARLAGGYVELITIRGSFSGLCAGISPSCACGRRCAKASHCSARFSSITAESSYPRPPRGMEQVWSSLCSPRAWRRRLRLEFGRGACKSAPGGRCRWSGPAWRS
jgi:hypothetical protein